MTVRPIENFLEAFEKRPKCEKVLQNPHPSHFQPDLARRGEEKNKKRDKLFCSHFMSFYPIDFILKI